MVSPLYTIVYSIQEENTSLMPRKHAETPKIARFHGQNHRICVYYKFRGNLGYEDFFDNPAAENLQEIHRLLGCDDPFITCGPGTAALALAKDVFFCS
jgi:hypothetical protein